VEGGGRQEKVKRRRGEQREGKGGRDSGEGDKGKPWGRRRRGKGNVVVGKVRVINVI
jgi:hypothetical protein